MDSVQDGVRHRRTAAAHSGSEISPLNSKGILMWILIPVYNTGDIYTGEYM